ncbi:MAG: hypothetical protein M3N41_10220 [Acidobacteriota bacterium]|nr:hypothetical protein [Acidobacteriota bacterium]
MKITCEECNGKGEIQGDTCELCEGNGDFSFESIKFWIDRAQQMELKYKNAIRRAA